MFSIESFFDYVRVVSIMKFRFGSFLPAFLVVLASSAAPCFASGAVSRSVPVLPPTGGSGLAALYVGGGAAVLGGAAYLFFRWFKSRR